MDSHTEEFARLADSVAASPELGVVRAELADIEALEDEIRHRVSHLRAVLAPDEFRLAWALRDAEERHGHAAHLVTVRTLVDDLARRLPEHGTLIRAAGRRATGGDAITDEVS